MYATMKKKTGERMQKVILALIRSFCVCSSYRWRDGETVGKKAEAAPAAHIIMPS